MLHPEPLGDLEIPEPEEVIAPPGRLRDAVWGSFVGFLGQHRALEILAFVVLYKLSDNLTQALASFMCLAILELYNIN